MYYLAERLWKACEARGVSMLVNIITNGLLLTPEVVDRLAPFGLNGVKVTLDGDRDTHNRMRPLRGGQGTFDKILHNIRQVAGKCRISIGGNFDDRSVDSYPALLDFLREQEFADKLSKVAFKPVIRERKQEAAPAPAVRRIEVHSADGGQRGGKPLGGACMTSAGAGARTERLRQLPSSSTRRCRSCARRRTSAASRPSTACTWARARSTNTTRTRSGPDGSLYACPGFAGDATQSTGHIDGREETAAHAPPRNSRSSAAWKDCDDCAFIPVCAGGCSVAAHTELGDMNTPNCHKTALRGRRGLARARGCTGAGGRFDQLVTITHTTHTRRSR